VYIIVGLGNPGSRYERTRHNIGWRVLDTVVDRQRAEWRAGIGEFYTAEFSVGGNPCVLVKPTTYMNNSGVAATDAIRNYGADIASEVLVVADEFQLPVGTVRMNLQGGDGGHNGLASVIYHTMSDRFPRLRCGIGRNFGPGELIEYVLAPFDAEEEPLVAPMIARAADAVEAMVSFGVVKAMNVFNSKRLLEVVSREE
jgi:PTH1 family peptidyl-tRNA hydrolase